MKHRLEKLRRNSRLEEPRIAIVSMWDVENNAVRILAATLRAAGHSVIEIYFKDWISNDLEPASDRQLENLAKVLRREEINLVALSIRASSYANQAKIITEYVQNEMDLPVLWGGMHPTLMSQECVETADMVLQGEAEYALLEFMNGLKYGSEDWYSSANVWFRHGADSIQKNARRPLIQDLDALEFRDYTTHSQKYFIYGNTYIQGDPMVGDPVF